MNDIVGDLLLKTDINKMYVLNQKASSHFPNNVPTGPMYFPDNGMHPTGQMIADQMPFSPCIPSIMPSINSHNQIQSNMSRFINPQNANSIRQHSIMTSTMMAQANKNQKSAMIACSIPDETSMQYQAAADNFPSMTTSYKSRNTSLDSSQNNTINNTNLGSDVINATNIPTDQNIGLHVNNTNRSQTPRNKRSRTNNNRATPPCAKDVCTTQTAMVSSHNNNNNNGIRPQSTNMNVMPINGPGVPQHKCLPPTPLNGTLPMQYNMVDMVPQQIRQRMPVNVINTYGCNRPQMIDKNMTIFPPGTHPGSMFNASPHNIPPFYSQIDNGLPLPMFHLHSRLSKLQECDRLTFPVNHGNLWGPQTLRHGDQVTEIQFELSQDNLQQIISRSDLDIVVTSFTHRDQFRLCHWPDFLELRINGHLLSLDTTVMQELKVHMPSCIKRYCKLGINILQFTVTKCVCCHLFHAFMVHRPTLQHAIETIQAKSTSSVITKSLLSEIYLRNSGLVNTPDDANNVCVVNLICPMSQARISIPARTKFCKHIQPFDLQEFLKVQTKWPQYFCPICRVRVTFNLNEYVQNIIVDEIIKDIISKVDLTVKRIICYPDGKWKPAIDGNSNCVVPFVPPNLSENHNHEPSYQAIRQSPIAARSSNMSPLSVHSKPNLCIDQMSDKKSKLVSNSLDFECNNSELKSNKSPCISNISSSTMPSPAPPRNVYGTSMTAVDSLSRSDTPVTSVGIEPSPPKRHKISPKHQINGETFSNVPVMKFPNSSTNEPIIMNEMFSRNINPFQTETFAINQNLNFGSPESIKTPLSTTSISSANQVASMASISSQTMSVFPNQIKPSLANNNFPATQIVSSSREQSSIIHQETDTSHISSTTGSGTSINSIRPPTSVNGDNVNKQASSGSSDPSSPPEFFDPHSATTNYDDDDNSSLHLQRLIGFIDEILSEEEEYVLDTQWASFTWPSADKSLDLLHLSDIEKFL